MNRIQQAFDNMSEEYREALQIMTPSRFELSSNGIPQYPHLRFSEANLVSSFLRNYKDSMVSNQCVIWQEYPFREKEKAHSGHIDGLIIDQADKALLFVEAKRLDKKSKLESKEMSSRHNSLVEDFQRISEDLKDRQTSKLLAPLKDKEMRNWDMYIVLLVDATYQGWAISSGFIDYFQNLSTNLLYNAITGPKDSINGKAGTAPMTKIPVGDKKALEYFQGYLSYRIPLGKE